VAILKTTASRRPLYEILQNLSLTMFEQMPLINCLPKIRRTPIGALKPMNLFD
jgi:hypothetical protein